MIEIISAEEKRYWKNHCSDIDLVLICEKLKPDDSISFENQQKILHISKIIGRRFVRNEMSDLKELAIRMNIGRSKSSVKAGIRKQAVFTLNDDDYKYQHCSQCGIKLINHGLQFRYKYLFKKNNLHYVKCMNCQTYLKTLWNIDDDGFETTFSLNLETARALVNRIIFLSNNMENYLESSSTPETTDFSEILEIVNTAINLWFDNSTTEYEKMMELYYKLYKSQNRELLEEILDNIESYIGNGLVVKTDRKCDLPDELKPNQFKILVQCPTCSKRGNLVLDKNTLQSKGNHLVNVVVRANLICEHVFSVTVDISNHQVRNTQKSVIA